MASYIEEEEYKEREEKFRDQKHEMLPR